MINIKFLGAAKTVTGSSFLVTTQNVKFLVDSGMFQGQEVEHMNYLPYEYNPSELDFVLLTHAHIDHMGLVPKLVKNGFRGPIFCTTETSAIACHLLLDSAKIQENGNKNRHNKTSRMIYDTTDALESISMIQAKKFGEGVDYKGVEIEFERAGHALGAASIKIKLNNKVLYFSGDIGREEHPFLESFEQTEKSADYIIMESLYGGEHHEQRSVSTDKFLEKINLVLQRNGNVIIPAFALQRGQEILNILKKAYQENRINRKVAVLLDSPLAEKITRIYTQSIFLNNFTGKQLFEFEELRFVRNKKRVSRSSLGQSIIIAGSGMCEGGRILGHLSRFLPEKKNGVFIVGYQADGTLGRELLNGKKQVVINQREIPVRSDIYSFLGFSAHAEHDELSKWLRRFDFNRLQNIYLVHAEKERMEKFIKLEKIEEKAVIPFLNQNIQLEK